MSAQSLESVIRSIRELLRRAGWVRHLALGAYLRAINRRPEAARSLPDLGSFARVLIVRLDEIGDFVLTTPLLRAVRQSFPALHVSLLVSSKVMALAYDCPYVDEVIPFDIVRAPRPFDQVVSLMRARAFARRRLAGGKFQCALIPRADIDNAGAAAMSHYAGIPVRIGYSERVLPLKAIKNAGYDGFLTHAVAALHGRHEVQWSLNLALLAGAKTDDTRLELWPGEALRASVAARLERFKGGRGFLVALAPGANLDRRQWPASRFAAVARTIIRQRGAKVVIVGGADDVALAERLAAEAGCAESILDLTGKLSLGETASLLAQCRLFIGNDSGPMHIAAAMGAPCVEISCHPKDGDALAANSPARFSPWGIASTVLQPERATHPCVDSCSKSEAHCIRQIGVEEVLLAACRLLDGGFALADRKIEA